MKIKSRREMGEEDKEKWERHSQQDKQKGRERQKNRVKKAKRKKKGQEGSGKGHEDNIKKDKGQMKTLKLERKTTSKN